MSQLIVDEIGPASSVQDRGRFGAQRFGLGPGGAMDIYALAAANALVGQPVDGAAIEIGPLPGRFTAKGGAVRIGLYGAEREVDLGGRKIPVGESILIGEGETLRLGFAKAGLFTYLAIDGGITGTPVFGSLSVNSRAGLGAPFARPLQAGDAFDIAHVGDPAGDVRIAARKLSGDPIRVVLGPQDDHFTQAALADFLGQTWKVSPTSDRMGYRLEGPKLAHKDSANIVSDGTVKGHIQVPGNGQPLVLMADRGTTGGYPKIATIITADLDRFAQMPGGSTFTFAAVDVAEASALARKYWRAIKVLPNQIEPAGARPIAIADLLAGNLAGQAVSALDDATWADIPGIAA